MLKQIDDEVLEVLVNNICETLTSFSAYDVTTILRSKLKNHQIDHNIVRGFVQQYVAKNNLSVKNNGTYNVYSKVITIASNVTHWNKNLNNNYYVSSNVFTPKPANKQTNLTLQTENRLNLTSIVRKYFPKEHSVSIKKSNSKIVITPYSTYSIGQQYSTNREIRLRTRFSTGKVKATLYNDVLTIEEIKV